MSWPLPCNSSPTFAVASFCSESTWPSTPLRVCENSGPLPLAAAAEVVCALEKPGTTAAIGEAIIHLASLSFTPPGCPPAALPAGCLTQNCQRRNDHVFRRLHG